MADSATIQEDTKLGVADDRRASVARGKDAGSSSNFSSRGRTSSLSRVNTASETRSAAGTADRDLAMDIGQGTDDMLNGRVSNQTLQPDHDRHDRQPTGRKRRAQLDKSEKRLKKQLSVRFKKSAHGLTPKLPVIDDEFRNNSFIIHDANRGIVYSSKELGEVQQPEMDDNVTTDHRHNKSLSAGPNKHSPRGRGPAMRLARQSKSMPTSLPTINEGLEFQDVQENEPVRSGGKKVDSRVPVMPSLIDAYKKLSFVQSSDAAGNDDQAFGLAPARSVWRTLPMESELDKYINSIRVSKKQTHSFSKYVLPGLGFQRGGPIARPHSGSKPNQFLRQRTRFGDDVIWGQMKDYTGKRTTAVKLKSAQNRADKLFTELKSALEEKR